MEVKVNVSVELGPSTLALFSNGLFASGKARVIEPKAEEPPVKEEPVKREAPKKEEPAAFGDMKPEDQLEAIKAAVSKHVKKGKSADIKFMLAHFDASRASELDPKHYGAFYEALGRYGKGEKPAELFPEEDLG
jgi:hypothetical protein